MSGILGRLKRWDIGESENAPSPSLQDDIKGAIIEIEEHGQFAFDAGVRLGRACKRISELEDFIKRRAYPDEFADVPHDIEICRSCGWEITDEDLQKMQGEQA